MQGIQRWNNLYDIAAEQAGHFTAMQAKEAGFSLPLLEHHCQTGRIFRVQRSIYRVRHYPPDDHEDLVVLWLWSGQQGCFSHGTALALHDLSDYLPTHTDMTVPANWKGRRLQLAANLKLHCQDLEPSEKNRFGCFQITTVVRTLVDCARVGLSPEWLEQAQDLAHRRGLLPASELLKR